MAVYKVPQNVEADDKLLGPFSFKQFIFLIVSVAFFGAAWALFSVMPLLIIVPLPIALFFGALALPLRKDQPMEVYLAAIISFIMKPKQRIWKADGIEHLVEVVAPRVEEQQYDKGINQTEVNRRLAYLATLVDSHGWSVRGVRDPNSSMQADLYNEAQSTADPLDDDSVEMRRLDHLISQSDEQRRQQITDRMKQTAPADQLTQTEIQPASTSMPTVASEMSTPSEPFSPPVFDPYPTMQQSVIRPLSNSPTEPGAISIPASSPQPNQQSTPTSAATSLNEVSPAIIDLAQNHSDLSVASLQREANRINREDDGEVMISLR